MNRQNLKMDNIKENVELDSINKGSVFKKCKKES